MSTEELMSQSMANQAERPQQTDLDNLTFKQAADELERVVRLLEANELELEESLEAYERGVALLKTLQGRLSGAEQKVTELLAKIEPEDQEADK